MKTVRLGKTNLLVSRVGIGGIPITRPTPDDAVRVVRRALDLGITFIDTAFGYADSEERIGRGIAGRRDGVVLATKTPYTDRKRSLECLETSLRRLATDRIDIWQLHGVNSPAQYEQILGPGGAMEAAVEARRAGKVGHIGLSSHRLEVAQDAVASGLFETVQFPFNIVESSAAESLVPLARVHDVGFIAMKPFAGGRLRDASLAIRYLLQFDTVVPDPGIERCEEIDEIAGIVESGRWELSPSEVAAVEELRLRLHHRFCRQCEYCMPCPNGVLIHHLTYLPVLWELWPPELLFTWRYVTDGVESADRCVGCGECEKKCPYGLPIREMIAESLDFYRRQVEFRDAVWPV